MHGRKAGKFPAGMRKAKSRHDKDTTGVRVEIISLCMLTELLRFNTVPLSLLQFRMTIASVHMVRFS